MKIDFSKVVTIESKNSERINTLKGIISNKRYEYETKGISVNGVNIDTGRDSQSLITSAALAALIDKTYVCRWKTSSGFITLDSEALLKISQEMRKYVQACFDREEELVNAVMDGTYTEALLIVGWPNAQIQN